LLTKVKTTPLPEQFYWDHFNTKLTENTRDFKEKDYAIYLPKLDNVQIWLEKWFQQKVMKDLLIIKRTILEDTHLSQDSNLMDFYKLCFARTILDVSNAVYDGSSTHIRKYLQSFSPNTFQAFIANFREIKGKIREFTRQTNSKYVPEIIHNDCNVTMKNLAKPVNTIITSPPYGDEHNTIGYSRWTKFFLYWLDYTQETVLENRKKTLGG